MVVIHVVFCTFLYAFIVLIRVQWVKRCGLFVAGVIPSRVSFPPLPALTFAAVFVALFWVVVCCSARRRERVADLYGERECDGRPV